MGRSCILDSHPGRWMPTALRMPAVVQMPAGHSRRFKGERPIGAGEGAEENFWPKLTDAEGAKFFFDWPKAQRKILLPSARHLTVSQSVRQAVGRASRRQTGRQKHTVWFFFQSQTMSTNSGEP